MLKPPFHAKLTQLAVRVSVLKPSTWISNLRRERFSLTNRSPIRRVCLQYDDRTCMSNDMIANRILTPLDRWLLPIFVVTRPHVYLDF